MRTAGRIRHVREQPGRAVVLIAAGTVLSVLGVAGHSALGLLGFLLIPLGIWWMPGGREVKLPVTVAFPISFPLIVSGALG